MGDLLITTEVGSTDDIVRALLEYLVDPLLPLKASSVRGTPSLSQHESVAKQIHATVLLYNYYQRNHPELQLLDFESFCKLFVTLKPSLTLYMKSTHQLDHDKLYDHENQLSPTEKAIMNACYVSRTLLDTSEDISSSIKEWPIVKVAVLLVDSTKENCLLLFSSVTNGVWSVIEKDFDSESLVVGSKRKRFKISKPSFKEHEADDEAGFQNAAFLAVKESSGINRTDLKVLESNAVYTLSKEKTAARFYILQSTQAISEDCKVPIKDVIDSLQGPLVSKSSGSWMVTPAVEYFHLLPYAGIISDWFSSEVLFNSLDDRARTETVDVDFSWNPTKKTCKQELGGEAKGVTSNTSHNVNVELDCVTINSLSINKPCDMQVIENRDSADKCCINLDRGKKALVANEAIESPCDNKVMVPGHCGDKHEIADKSFIILDGDKKELVANEAVENPCDKKVMVPGHCRDKHESVAIESPGLKKCNESCMVDISNPTSGLQSMDMDENPVGCLPKEKITTGTPKAIKVYQSQKRRRTSTPSADCYQNYSTNGMKIQTEQVTNLKTKLADLKTESCPREFQNEKVDTEKVSWDASRNLHGAKAEDRSLVPSELKTSYEEKVQVKESCRSDFQNEKVDIGKVSCDVSENLYRARTEDCSLVPFELKMSYKEKVQVTLASKETALSQTALRVLVRKREKLCNELHNLEDEVAVCEQNIRAIIDGAENNLAIKLEAILDFCNDMCFQSKAQAQYSMNQDAENQGLLQYPMGKRLSEAILSVRTPCQELNNICCANNWMLPIFRITPCDGGYLGNVTVKGLDFECSCGSDLHPTPDGARNMAAERIIDKLQNMASQLQ